MKALVRILQERQFTEEALDGTWKLARGVPNRNFPNTKGLTPAKFARMSTFIHTFCLFWVDNGSSKRCLFDQEVFSEGSLFPDVT